MGTWLYGAGLAVCFATHTLLAVLRDALRFASPGTLKASLERHFAGEELRRMQARMEVYFSDIGRNLRELEWFSYMILSLCFGSSLLFFLSGRGEVPLADVLEVLGATAFTAFALNYFLLRAFSEPFAEPVLIRGYLMFRCIHVFMSPLTAALGALQIGVMRMAGQKQEDEEAQGVLDSMDRGERAGVFEDSEREMIENIIEFKDLCARDVMTPRTEMVAVTAAGGLEAAVRRMMEENFSRILVYEENRDNILGYLHVRDALPYWGQTRPAPPLRELLHPVPFVPETKKIRDLFQEFKRQRQHIAIVLDEYGGTAGLVTIEDILEEIVGEIVDEHQEADEVMFTRTGPGEARVSARTRVAEINELLELALPEDDSYDSVGGWLTATLGRIPATGEQGEIEDLRLRYKVLDASPRKIETLLLSKTASHEPG